MEDIKLSKKGNALIKLYEEMAEKGVDRWTELENYL